MKKKCKKCGVEYVATPPKDNARVYCHSCSLEITKENRKKARQKYNRLHPYKPHTHTRRCNWCGMPFLSTRNQQYCSSRCRRYARQEQVLRAVQRYNTRKGKSEKQVYFDNLGNSNLREHRKEDYEDEERLIRAEKRRLRI